MRNDVVDIKDTYPEIFRRCCRPSLQLGPRGSFSSCRPRRLFIPRLTLVQNFPTNRRSLTLPRILHPILNFASSTLRTPPSPFIFQSWYNAMNETTPSPTPGPATKPSKSPSSATAGVKRKRGSAGKYYAVKSGYQPGIYYEWKECLAQVTGFKGAVFQAFPSLDEANAFLTGAKFTSPRGASPLGSEPTRFYAIQRGHKPGVYTNWANAQEQIKGFQKPRYKKFATREEAEEFVKLGGETPAQSAETETTPQNLPGAPGLTSENPKDAQGAPIEAGRAPLPPGAEDGFDPNVLLDPKTGKVVYKTNGEKATTKAQPKGPPGMLRIYTDGSSLKNGRTHATAGVGVYFGPGDTRFVLFILWCC
ncbi:Caulimovirus viroplasmin-domain-containing protein [Aspergillus cavernicola]|uniref:Caulimovirus viroplasmin-domain-containing protein n=1 Tax=Aspergillus cavernicola TaxID=176166 RepID=A0ABR4HZ77_9EURO